MLKAIITDPIRQVVCGAQHSLFLKDQQVYVCGSSYYGQCGYQGTATYDDDDENGAITEPTPVAGIPSMFQSENVKAIAAGDFHSLILYENGKLLTFGSGILGLNNELYDSMPQEVSYFSDIKRKVVQIAAKGTISMALAHSVDDKNFLEPYLWGYYRAGKDGWRKSLHPVLIQHALKMDKIYSLLPGLDGTFAIMGDMGKKRIIQIYSDTKSSRMRIPQSPKYAEVPNVTEVYTNPPIMELEYPLGHVDEADLGKGMLMIKTRTGNFIQGSLRVVQLIHLESQECHTFDSIESALPYKICLTHDFAVICASNSVFAWRLPPLPPMKEEPLKFTFKYVFPWFDKKAEEEKVEEDDISWIRYVKEFQPHKIPTPGYPICASGYDHYFTYSKTSKE